jgi:S-adenosylmethionine decarboxylase
LSESSLFVYPLKLVLKTCGTTTLLMALPRLLQVTQVRLAPARARLSRLSEARVFLAPF